MEVAPP